MSTATPHDPDDPSVDAIILQLLGMTEGIASAEIPVSGSTANPMIMVAGSIAAILHMGSAELAKLYYELGQRDGYREGHESGHVCATGETSFGGNLPTGQYL